jgi:predicted nucleic acid-binding protein
MNRLVIADTGPLVALFNQADTFHAWAKDCLGRIDAPLLTSEAVLTEVLFLLAPMRKSRAAFEDFCLEGGLRLALDTQAHLESLIALLRKYADLPMSLADATVVRICELNHRSIVWTLDSHFRIYRHLGRKTIPLLDWPRD